MQKLKRNLGLLALVLSVPAGGLDAQGDSALRERTVATVLAAAVQANPGTLAAELERDTPASAPFLFEILAARGVPAGWSADRRTFVRLDGAWLAEVRAALLDMPLGQLRSLLLGVQQTEPRMLARAVGVELIGAVGRTQDMRLTLRLAAPLQGGNEVLPRTYRKVLEHALVGLLDRGPGGYYQLESEFRNAHVGLRATLVDAIAHFSNPRALATLTVLLGQARGLDAHILAAIARMAPTVPHPVDDRTRANVRAFLFNGDLAVVSSAIRAVGALEDFDALATLVDLLSESGQVDRGIVHRALRDITGLRLRPNAKLWKAWLAAEERWWAVEQHDRVADLRDGDLVSAIKAISSFAGRRLERHEVAGLLQQGLLRPEPEAVRKTCQALGQIGSRAPLKALIDVLERGDEGTRRAAWDALVAITGWTHPQDPRPWRVALEADSTNY